MKAPAREPIVVRGCLTKIRFLRSAAANRSRWETIISDLPSTSTPLSLRAKWKWRRMRDCVSALKYISVFRQISTSSREIGASWTRLLRPKITVRRRSLRNSKRWSAGWKYCCRSSGGTDSVSLAL